MYIFYLMPLITSCSSIILNEVVICSTKNIEMENIALILNSTSANILFSRDFHWDFCQY